MCLQAIKTTFKEHVSEAGAENGTECAQKSRRMRAELEQGLKKYGGAEAEVM